MDYRIYKEFNLLILVLQHIFVDAHREAEIQTLHAEDSFSENRIGNNNRQIK